jgi:serine/threonine-protein kinase RsbW
MDKSGKRPAKSIRDSRPIRENDRMEIPSSLDHLPAVDQFIEEKLKRLGIDKSQIYDIAISVSEVVTNAVKHGNQNDLNRRVKIDLKADASRVEVTVEDEGSGFDRECICSPFEGENLLKEAGRGLLIVESLMDELSICRKPKGGTQVKIVKNIR